MPSQEEREALEALMADDAALEAMAQQEQYNRQAARQGEELHMSQAKPIPPLPKQVKPLEFYKASELYGKQLKRPPVIVEGMIPAGLTVLAGAPKRGKSWMALKLALCVSKGDKFLGFPTKRGSVLYLDLESRQYRVQDRLSRLIPGAAPDNLYIAHQADKLDGDLLEQLKSWASQVENPSMIIIDTVGRVKGGTRRGENAYEGDTRIFGQMQSFALENSLALICVHHLRKDNGNNDDYFERISGSMGFTGACDAVMVLAGKRGEETSTLKTSSRDFDSQDFVMKFNSGDWELVSCNSEEYAELQEYNASQMVRGIIAVAKRYNCWRGTVNDLNCEMSETLGEPVEEVHATQFGRQLSHFAPMLKRRDGIVITVQRGKGGKRSIKIETEQSHQVVLPEEFTATDEDLPFDP